MGLARLTALTSLNLADCDLLTDQGVKALRPLTNLTNLDLANCPRVTADGARSLADKVLIRT